MTHRRPPCAASNARKTVGPRASMSSSVLGRLVMQDKDLEVLGGVTAAGLGEELDGAAQGQVGGSWQHRGASAVGPAETPRWHSEVNANPQLMGPVSISAPYGTSTASWWRSIRISRSLVVSPRQAGRAVGSSGRVPGRRASTTRRQPPRRGQWGVTTLPRDARANWQLRGHVRLCAFYGLLGLAGGPDHWCRADNAVTPWVGPAVLRRSGGVSGVAYRSAPRPDALAVRPDGRSALLGVADP
jgi:hypothetical protein